MKPFPPEFQFGVGNADHQCEAFEPIFEDVRDVWDSLQGNAPRGKATDFANRFPEDIQLAANLGCKMFRFSVSWARVEPQSGTFDPSQIEHYDRIVKCIRSCGMQPMVTLLHFTWPVHVQDRGGMLADDFPLWFTVYASKMAHQLGDQVVYWNTFNEPNILSYGYTKPWWERNYRFPPGLPDGTSGPEQIKAIAKLIRNLFLAHSRARKAIQEVIPNAKVGVNPSLLGLPPWLQSLVDRIVTKVSQLTELEENGKRLTERTLVAKGKADVVAATFTVTEQRQESIDFSEVYYVASQDLLVPSQSTITHLEDLADKTVAVVATSTAQQKITSVLPRSKALIVMDHRKGLDAVASGAADALLSDDSILRGLLSQFPGRFKVLSLEVSREPYALGLTRGNPSLLEVVDIAIRRFQDSGALARSVSVHVSDSATRRFSRRKRKAALAKIDGDRPRELDIGRPWPLAPKGTLLRRVQDRGHLEAAIHFNAPGFGYLDQKTGEFSGVEVDLCREIASLLFADTEKVRFTEVHTTERIPFLRSLLQWFDPIFRALSVVTTCVDTNWWHLGMAGRLPEFLCPPECVDQEDFVGLDYYWGFSSIKLWKIEGLVKAITKGRYDLAPVSPKCLYAFLKFYAKLFPGKEIILLENGCVDAASGIERTVYLQRHLKQVQKAIARGAPISNYVLWSITSNVEWGFSPAGCNDFGLYHIDLLNDSKLIRHETPAAVFYRDVIRKRSAET